VLDALIENALRYGGGDITVVARPGGIEVLDRGPGLDREELDAVFERFHRGVQGRAGPSGTGLGLAIARELARRWGGDVELANRREGGRGRPDHRARSASRALSRLLTASALPWPEMSHSVILWALAAIAGVVLVAGVTYAASGLSSQTIGLSSEPLGAGEELAPTATPSSDGRAAADRAAARKRAARRAAARAERRRRARARARARERATASPTAAPTVVPTVDDDNSGSGSDDSSGRGRGRGRGGDDSGDDD